MYRPLLKAIEPLTQIYPAETKDLDIDSLDRDINTEIEENSSHHTPVISEIYQWVDKWHYQCRP